MEYVGSVLRNKRKEKGLTIREAAKDIGISSTTIVHMDQGRESISMSRYRTYARYLGIDLKVDTDSVAPANNLVIESVKFRNTWIFGVSEYSLERFKENLEDPIKFQRFMSVYAVFTVDGITFHYHTDVLSAWNAYLNDTQLNKI